MTVAGDAALDCKTCGACCISDYAEPAYVDLTEDDVKRLSRRVVRLHVVDEYKTYPLAEPHPTLATKQNLQGHTVCALLRGTVGKRVSCGIYPTRPRACQVFRVGGSGCDFARRQAGIVGAGPRVECA